MGKSTVTIESLKSQGLKVALRHFEADETSGAQTQAAIIDESKGEVLLGVSRCNPCDSFNRKKGRIMALGRAVNARTQKVVKFSNPDELQSIITSNVYTKIDLRRGEG